MREGANTKTPGHLYLAVVQAILIFGFGNVGGDPTDGPPPGEFPPQGGEKAVGDATIETDGRELVIPPAGMYPLSISIDI